MTPLEILGLSHVTRIEVSFIASTRTFLGGEPGADEYNKIL